MASSNDHLSQRRIAIIGGGLAGLSTAVQLVKLFATRPDISRPTIELFESRQAFGGRAGTFTDSQSNDTLDLCQHVSLGCCTEFANFIKTIGAGHEFRRDRTLYFLANKEDGSLGRINSMRAMPVLPAPLHLSWSLMRLDYLSWREKLKIAGTLLRLMLRTSPNDDGQTTFAQFLNDANVSARVQEVFFQPVVVSALSVSMEEASLAAARKVFLDAFIKNSRGYELLVPMRPIGEILESHAIPWLTSRGVAIHRGSSIKRVAIDQSHVTGVERSTDNHVKVQNVVVAVPWLNVRDLFDPSAQGFIPELEKISHLHAAPIVSVHLWYDQALMQAPHLVLPGRTSQWLFAGSIQNNVHHYQVIISAAYTESKIPRKELVQKVVQELQETLLTTRDAKLLRSQVIVQARAVFAPTPGHEKFRPAAKATTVTGLYFAGDWVATGWPATMEGAIRSGINAAQSIVANLT